MFVNIHTSRLISKQTGWSNACMHTYQEIEKKGVLLFVQHENALVHCFLIPCFQSMENNSYLMPSYIISIINLLGFWLNRVENWCFVKKYIFIYSLNHHIVRKRVITFKNIVNPKKGKETFLNEQGLGSSMLWIEDLQEDPPNAGTP